MTEKYRYRCTDCGKSYPGGQVMYLCPDCSSRQQPGQPPLGVLRVEYDYDGLRKLSLAEISAGDYLRLMPFEKNESMPYLRVGHTPLYELNSLGTQTLRSSLLLKDDSQNPTFSFKDRASAVVSAFARENNIQTLVAASTGNAGSSLAGICASQNQKTVIFAPASAPKAKLTQILMYGAHLVPVDGNYDAAFDLSVEMTHRFGYYNRNTAFNPLTIEGKKTVAFELFDQMNQQVPDRIFVPVGDGVIISGVYKGYEDLLKLGLISKMPVVVAVQAEGSSNLVNNIGSSIFRISPSHTVADSISVDIPRNFNMAAGFLTAYNGESTVVTDHEIVEASAVLSRNTGIFTEPAAAAAFAGFLKYMQNSILSEGSRNVVLLTGSGLKDLAAVQPAIRVPEPVRPDIQSVIEFLDGKI